MPAYPGDACVGCGTVGGSHDLTCPEAPANQKRRAVCATCHLTDGMHTPMCPVPHMDKKPVDTGEIRSTSSTGGQKGVKPQRMSLLPFGALAKIGEVYGFGEKKYAAHNWRKGYEWDKSIDALERHIGAFKDGEDNDPESGLPHIAHAGFHILTLLTFILNPKKYRHFDNRYKEDL